MEKILLYMMSKKEVGRVPIHNLEGIVSFGYRGQVQRLWGLVWA